MLASSTCAGRLGWVTDQDSSSDQRIWWRKIEEGRDSFGCSNPISPDLRWIDTSRMEQHSSSSAFEPSHQPTNPWSPSLSANKLLLPSSSLLPLQQASRLPSPTPPSTTLQSSSMQPTSFAQLSTEMSKLNRTEWSEGRGEEESRSRRRCRTRFLPSSWPSSPLATHLHLLEARCSMTGS